MLKKINNKLIKLKLTEIGISGDTTANIENETISVFGGIPGEEVLAEIRNQKQTKRKQNQRFATVKHVIKSSKHRVSTPCSFYGFCTGCNWQHIDYEYQLILKKQLLENEILKITNEKINIQNIIKSKDQYNYRNHARFTIRKNGQIGFTNKVNKKFVSINKCLIMNEKINTHIQNLETYVGETSQMSVRVGINKDSYLIQPKFKNNKIKTITGQKSYYEKIDDYNFQISSPSFFQVNSSQIITMKNTILSLLKNTNNNLLIDAYAGVGTFGILLSNYFKKIIGIEQSYSAVVDAKYNIRELGNYEIIIGNSEEILSTIKSEIDVLLLDPSRKGCDEKLIQNLIVNPVKNIIYISCEPKTLARDLKLLTHQSKYIIKSITPIDLFPNTHHVESITLLTLNN
jgi:23S rRNA (uracil1939-C5)-methyltransferase